MSELCPVCGGAMRVYVDTIDWGGPIAEHHEICLSGKCYSYEYSYGYTSVLVGDRQFGWAYNTDKEALHAEQAAVEAAIEAAREDKARRPEEQG